MNERVRSLLLPGGLAAATLGMALVAIGVALPGVFFVGVYLLAIGLLVTAAGAVLRLFERQTS